MSYAVSKILIHNKVRAVLYAPKDEFRYSHMGVLHFATKQPPFVKPQSQLSGGLSDLGQGSTSE